MQNVNNNKKNNTDFEQELETLNLQYKQVKSDYNILAKTVATVYMPLMLYSIADYQDRSEYEIENFCKDVGMDWEEFKFLFDYYMKNYKNAIEKYKKKNSNNIKKKNNDVGYGKPPIGTRFQKGNKGNPKGRKPKKDANLIDLLADELTKRIAITKNGKKKYAYKKEIVIQQMLNQLMTGARVPKNNVNIIKLIDKYVNSKKSLKRIFGIE